VTPAHPAGPGSPARRERGLEPAQLVGDERHHGPDPRDRARIAAGLGRRAPRDAPGGTAARPARQLLPGDDRRPAPPRRPRRRVRATDQHAAARTFKPDPRAYQLGIDRFGLPRDQIAFAAFGGWDAAGATWFGYPTFWVNRLGVELDPLATPTAIGRNLDQLAAWIATRHVAG
jgi:hypothetical protein